MYLMCSRNKDNKEIDGFRERSKNILEYRENEDKVIKEFKKFANDGVPGEKTRLYRSVNSRNEDKVRDDFIIKLLKDKPSMTKLRRVIASVSQQICNRDESKWLFDFDVDDEIACARFIGDVSTYSNIPVYEIERSKTPNGYALVVPHGFDTRELMKKWEDYDVTLKKDELLFLDIIQKKNGCEYCDIDSDSCCIYINPLDNQYYLDIETNQWDEYDDGFVHYREYIDYCPYCGRKLKVGD